MGKYCDVKAGIGMEVESRYKNIMDAKLGIVGR